MKKILLFAILAVLLLPVSALATLGVGVGSGKIVLDQPLRPGGTYSLPSLTVINTGDEASDYEVGISFHEGQKELKPSADWFKIPPTSFRLAPGEAKVVDISISLPVKCASGDYFAYLEGRPLTKAENGTSKVGIAAASKLYFSIIPATLWQGYYYKLLDFWHRNLPWTNIILIAVVLLIIILVLRKYFTFNIGVGRKKKNKE